MQIVMANNKNVTVNCTTEMIEVDRIDNVESIERIKPRWKELLAQSETDVVFLLPEWLHTWWTIYGARKDLYLLVARDGDAIIGIAPFMRTVSSRMGIKSKVIEFIGTPNIDYADIIASDKRKVIAAILNYLERRQSDWTRIQLSQIPEYSSTPALFRELCPGMGGGLDIREIESCSAFVFEGSDQERAAFEFKRSKTVKSAINFFQREKGLFNGQLKEPETVKRYLPLLFQLHVNRWEGTPTPSKFLDEQHRRFYEELLVAMPENISFYCIRHGDIPVACSFNFRYKDKIYFYTLAINQFYKRRSPGQITFVLQGDDYVRSGYALDYSRGAYGYKSIFANRASKNYQVTIFSGASELWRTKAVDRLKATKTVTRILQSKTFQDLRIRFVRKIREHGIKGIALGMLGKLGGIFNRYIIEYREFFVMRFDGIPDLSVESRIPVQFKRLTAEDAENIVTFYGAREDSPKHKTVIERFQKNADCFAATHNGHIVSIYWGLYHTDYHAELNLSLTPQSDEVILSDAYTTPIYRGMKILPFLMARQLQEYRTKGFKAVAGVARKNKPSRRVLSGFNFKHVKTIRYLRIFGIRLF